MTITWESPVTEVVWESQTAPGITWTTVVGGTGGTEIPARRLLPNTVGTPGQTVAVNEAGTAVEYVDAPTGGSSPTVVGYIAESRLDDETGFNAYDGAGALSVVLWADLESGVTVFVRNSGRVCTADGAGSYTTVDAPAGDYQTEDGVVARMPEVGTPSILSPTSSGGAVDSVNGQTGVVVLTAADVGTLDSGGITTVASGYAADALSDANDYTDTAVAGKQAADADLTAIAALAPSDDALIQRKAGAWTSRTPAQVKADMSIGVGDVSGLDENTRDVIGAALVAGSGVAVTVDDPGNTITIAVSGVVADAINDGTTTVAPSQNAVFDALAAKAPIASPTFTGTPAAPTPAQGTNTTQLATTAYVQIEAGLLVPKSTVTTKGDLIVGTGSGAVTRRGIGSNGQVLTADSAQADGVKWAALTLQAPMVAGQDEGSTVSVGTSAVSLLDTTFAVPTDLVAGSALRLVAAMTYTQNGGGSYNWSWPVVLGSSTVLAAAAPSLGNSASLRWAWLDVMIRFEDVNDQNASGFLSLGSVSGAQLNSAPQVGGIAAENITLGKSLDLKVSTSVSAGTQQCTLQFATLTRFDP